MLQLDDLSFAYGSVKAVNQVTLEVAEGSIHGLIGPNGAGKSTCFDMLNGQNVPDSGRIHLLGRDTTGRKPRDVLPMNVASCGCSASRKQYVRSAVAIAVAQHTRA